MCAAEPSLPTSQGWHMHVLCSAQPVTCWPVASVANTLKMYPSFLLPHGEFKAASSWRSKLFFYSHRKPGVYKLYVTLL